jgi:hypothetical protein
MESVDSISLKERGDGRVNKAHTKKETSWQLGGGLRTPRRTGKLRFRLFDNIKDVFFRTTGFQCCGGRLLLLEPYTSDSHFC